MYTVDPAVNCSEGYIIHVDRLQKLLESGMGGGKSFYMMFDCGVQQKWTGGDTEGHLGKSQDDDLGLVKGDTLKLQEA